MTVIRPAAICGGVISSLQTLRVYLVQDRLALDLLSGAAVILGIVLNWNCLESAGLVRILAVLPCALMMFSCLRQGPSHLMETPRSGLLSCLPCFDIHKCEAGYVQGEAQRS